MGKRVSQAREVYRRVPTDYGCQTIMDSSIPMSRRLSSQQKIQSNHARAQASFSKRLSKNTSNRLNVQVLLIKWVDTSFLINIGRSIVQCHATSYSSTSKHEYK